MICIINVIEVIQLPQLNVVILSVEFYRLGVAMYYVQEHLLYVNEK